MRKDITDVDTVAEKGQISSTALAKHVFVPFRMWCEWIKESQSPKLGDVEGRLFRIARYVVAQGFCEEAVIDDLKVEVLRPGVLECSSNGKREPIRDGRITIYECDVAVQVS